MPNNRFRQVGRALQILLGGTILASTTAAGQVTVERIAKQKKPVIGPTTEVAWIRSGAVDATPLKERQVLGLDDELSTSSSDIAVRLRCPGASIAQDGPFRLVVLDTKAHPCRVYVLKGTSVTMGDSPSSLQNGELVAGARGTMYSLTVVPNEKRRRDKTGRVVEPVRSVSVFEGEVEVASSNRPPVPLRAGLTAAATVDGLRLDDVTRETITRVADLYARVDASSPGINPEIRDAAIVELRKGYENVLQSGASPRGSGPAQLDLATTQLRLGVVSPDALYHLRKAAGSDTTEGLSAAAYTWLKGAVLQDLGENAEATRAYAKARRLDPQVAKRITERYRLSPDRMLRATTLIKPDSL